MTDRNRSGAPPQPTVTVYFARGLEGLSAESVARLGSEVGRDLTQAGLRLLDPGALEASLVQDLGLVDLELKLLRQADAVLMDLSVDGRSYVGCICEMVYARNMGLPVFVYCGQSSISGRLWLQYHATTIRVSRAEAIQDLLDWFAERGGKSEVATE